MTHGELVKKGAHWLINNGFNPVFAEQGAADLFEFPDVIGWHNESSTIFEIKVSMEDFKRDTKKIFRQTPELGMGNYRYYLVPEELEKQIYPLIPEGWGLKSLTSRGIHNSKESKCFDKASQYEVDFLVARIKEIQRFGKSLY